MCMCVRHLLVLSGNASHSFRDMCCSGLFISGSLNFIFSPKKKEINQKSTCPAMTVTKPVGKKLTLMQKERRLQ